MQLCMAPATDSHPHHHGYLPGKSARIELYPSLQASAGMWSHAESVAAQQSNLSMWLAIVKLPLSTSVLSRNSTIWSRKGGRGGEGVPLESCSASQTAAWWCVGDLTSYHPKICLIYKASGIRPLSSSGIPREGEETLTIQPSTSSRWVKFTSCNSQKIQKWIQMLLITAHISDLFSFYN